MALAEDPLGWPVDTMSDDEFPPQVEYPEGHSPFCHRDCDHEVHRPYDEWAARVEARSRAQLEHPDSLNKMEP